MQTKHDKVTNWIVRFPRRWLCLKINHCQDIYDTPCYALVLWPVGSVGEIWKYRFDNLVKIGAMAWVMLKIMVLNCFSRVRQTNKNNDSLISDGHRRGRGKRRKSQRG